MVGIGIAACRSSYCACSPDTCCIPSEWQWIWNAPGCALHNVAMHMVHLRISDFAPDSTYHFTGGPAYPPTDGKVSWGFVGDVWSAAECDDEAVNAGALVYCAMIDGQEAIVAEAFCFDAGQNIVGYKIGYTYDFSCDPFSFSIVTEDELCCGCNGDGGTSVNVDCCPNPVPSTLYATVTDGGTHCSGFTGQIVTLSYNGSTSKWEGSQAMCGVTYQFAFYCNSSPSWIMDIDAGACGSVTGLTSPAEVCDPFSVEFAWNHGAGCGCCDAGAPRSMFIQVTE